MELGELPPRPNAAEGGVELGPEGGDEFVPGSGPFGGSTTGGPPGLHPTNWIRLTFDPSDSDSVTPCERIQFIQTMQIFVDGVPVMPGDFAPNDWQYRDPGALDDDPEAESSTNGTHVDRLGGRSTPFYGGNGAGTGTSTPGTYNGGSTTGRMVDTPNVPPAYFAAAGAANEVKFVFETCAFCACGDDAGEFFEGITWEYVYTSADVAAGTPGTSIITGTTSGPSQVFLDAVERWCEANNFDLTEEC
jgi:hypothetical protein